MTASLEILFYVRGNIITLSYYSIGLNTFLLYLIWKDSEKKALQLMAGVSFAVSVLCMPYFILYFCGSLLLRIWRYKKEERNWKPDVWYYLGILCSAALFLGYCIFQGDFTDIFRNIGVILEDPIHQEDGLRSLLSFFFSWGKYFIVFCYIRCCWKWRG